MTSAATTAGEGVALLGGGAVEGLRDADGDGSRRSLWLG